MSSTVELKANVPITCIPSTEASTGASLSTGTTSEASVSLSTGTTSEASASLSTSEASSSSSDTTSSSTTMAKLASTASSIAPAPSDTVPAAPSVPTGTLSFHTPSQTCPVLDHYTPSLKLAAEINEINQLKTIQTGAQLAATTIPPMASSISRSSISAGISTLLAQTTTPKPSMSPTDPSHHPSDPLASATCTLLPASDSASNETASVDTETTAEKTQRKELNWVNAVPSHFDASSPNPRKRRRRTNRAELEILEDAFARNLLPNAATRQELGQRLGMSVRAVQIWFQNRRQSLRKKSISMQNLHSHPLQHSSADATTGHTTDPCPRTPALSLDCTFKREPGDDGDALEPGSQSSASDSSILMSPPMPSWHRLSSVEDDDSIDAMDLMERAKSCSDLLLSRRSSTLHRSDTLLSIPSLTSSLSTLSSASDSSFTSNTTALPPLAPPSAADTPITGTISNTKTFTKVDEPTTPSLVRLETMDPIAEEAVESSVPEDGASSPAQNSKCVAEEVGSAQDQPQHQQHDNPPISHSSTEPIGRLVDEKLAQHHLNVLLQEAKKDPATSASATCAVTPTTLAGQHPQAPVLASWDASAESKPILNAFGSQASVSVAAYAGSVSHPRSSSSKKLLKKASSTFLAPSKAATINPLAPCSSSAATLSTAGAVVADATTTKPINSANGNTLSSGNINSNANNTHHNAPRRYHYIKSRPKSLMEMVIHRQREQQREQQLQKQMQQALENHSPSLSTSEWPQRLPRPKKKSNSGNNSQGGTSSGSNARNASIASSNFRQSAVLANKQGRAVSTLAYPEYPAEFHPLHSKKKQQSTNSAQAVQKIPLSPIASSTLAQSSTYRDQQRARALEAEGMMSMMQLNNNTNSAAAASALQQLLYCQNNTSRSLETDRHRRFGDPPSSNYNSSNSNSNNNSDSDDSAHPSLSTPQHAHSGLSSSPTFRVAQPFAQTPARPKAFLSMPSLDTVCSWSQLKRVQSDSVLFSDTFLRKKHDNTSTSTITTANRATTGQKAQRARRLEIGRDLFQSDSDATVDQTEEEEEDEDEDEGDQRHARNLAARRFRTTALSKLARSGRTMTMQHLPTATRPVATTTTTPTATSLKRGRKTLSSRSIYHHHQRRPEIGEDERSDEIEHQRAVSGNHHHQYQSATQQQQPLLLQRGLQDEKEEEKDQEESYHLHGWPSLDHVHQKVAEDQNDHDDDNDDDDESEAYPIRRQRLSSVEASHRRPRRVSTSTGSSYSGHSRQSSHGGASGGGGGSGLAEDLYYCSQPAANGPFKTTNPTVNTTHSILPPVGYFSPPQDSAGWRPASPPTPPPSSSLSSLGGPQHYDGLRVLDDEEEESEKKKHCLHRPSSFETVHSAATALAAAAAAAAASAASRRPVQTPLSPTTPSPTRPPLYHKGLRHHHHHHNHHPPAYPYMAVAGHGRRPPAPPSLSRHHHQQQQQQQQQQHRAQSLDPLSAIADMALGEHEQEVESTCQDREAAVVAPSSSTLNKDELECASVLAGLGLCR